MTCATAAAPLFKNRFKKCLSHSFLRPVYLDERRFKSHSIFYRSAETAISSSDAENGLCGPVAVKRLKFGRLIYFYLFSSYTTV